jgi:hypothetical protein
MPDEADALRLPTSEREQWILAMVLVELEGDDIFHCLHTRQSEWLVREDASEACRWIDFVQKVEQVMDGSRSLPN